MMNLKEERSATLIVNQSGRGSSTFRATLPATWVRKMGLNENERDLTLEFDEIEKTIKIKKISNPIKE